MKPRGFLVVITMEKNHHGNSYYFEIRIYIRAGRQVPIFSYFFLFFSAYSYFSYFLAISSYFPYFLAILPTISKYLLEIWTF